MSPPSEKMGDKYYIVKRGRKKVIERFYKQNRKEIENKRVVISERLKDEQGEVVEWEIRPLMQKENEMILKKCRAMNKEKEQNFYEVMVLTESVVFPELNDIELQNRYHVVGREGLLLEMLTAGEYEKLKRIVEEMR